MSPRFASWSGRRFQLTVLLAIALLLAAVPAVSQTFTSLYNFTDGSDGANPIGGLVRDSVGNLYGTTANGGVGSGVVFKISSTNVFSVLYSFSGGDGSSPQSGLTRDALGNLYGTTYSGGTGGLGVVFKLDPVTKVLTILHSFVGGAADGAKPRSTLYRDTAGNLYGTTEFGGASGAGVVFKITVGGAFSLLHSFTRATDGAFPVGGVVLDSAGNLYGTAGLGGSWDYGTVYKISTNQTFSVLHNFTLGDDGGVPEGGLLLDGSGNLYGTTNSGGASGGFGTIFKIDSNNNFSVLYSMNGNSDGYGPTSTLVMDYAGVLYGTCAYGGGFGGWGTVFSLDPANHYAVRYTFQGTSYDQGRPDPGVIIGADGSLYGVAETNQFGYGNVFKLSAKAVLSSPAKNTTMPPGTVNFTWSPVVNGANSYQLWLGSSPGLADLGYLGTNANSGLVDLSAATPGQAVYATLWALVGGTWSQQDTGTYTAGTYAQIASPGKGSTISTTSTFIWSAESAATSYQLWLGTTPRGYDVGYAGTSNQSATFAGLPFGKTLYATLWGYAGGNWSVQDTGIYQTGGAGATHITSPANGSTLPGSTVKFTWSSLAGAGYQLWVGSTPQSHDLAYAGTILTNLTFSGLPTDGRQVYVTLWAYTGGTWIMEDTATYTAATVTNARQ